MGTIFGNCPVRPWIMVVTNSARVESPGGTIVTIESELMYCPSREINLSPKLSNMTLVILPSKV